MRAGRWLSKLVVWVLVVAVHANSLAQVVRPIIWGPHGAPQAGFTANGTLLQNGIITPNPHQGLHTLMNISSWTISAFAMSNTTDPNFVQPSLADMASALNLTVEQAVSQINTIYIGPNPYTDVSQPNANTAANAAAYEQILADYTALGGVAATTQGTGDYAMFGPDALMGTPVFQAALPDGSGAAGVSISESIESVTNGEAVANFNAIQIQNKALLGSSIFYEKHRIEPDRSYDCRWDPSACTLTGAQLHNRLFGAINVSSGVELGYIQENGEAHKFALGSNRYFETSRSLFYGEGDPSRPYANKVVAQNLVKATGQHIKGQQAAGSLNFDAFGEDRALFMQGVDLYAHVKSPADRALLDALRSGSLKPGDADYENAQALAQRSFSQAWAQHVEFDTKIVHNRESANYQAQRLQLQNASDQELFQQGLNLHCKKCDAQQEESLRQLQQGQLKEGDAGYQEARALAEQRFKDAYASSLLPPPKQSWFKKLAAVVVAAVAVWIIGPAVTQFMAGIIPGATAQTVAGATVLAGSGGTALTAGSVVASGIGSMVASTSSAFLSTSIATGSMSQGLKAAGNAMKGGLVATAVSLAAPALGFVEAGIGQTTVKVLANAAGNTAAGGGSFGENLLTAALNAGASSASAYVADAIGQSNASGNFGTLGTELAHAAVGCVSGAARNAIAGGSGGCAAGATGAVVAHVGAGWLDAATGYTLKDSEVSFYSGLMGGTAAALVGGKEQIGQNFHVGLTTGENAVEHNYVSYSRFAAVKHATAQENARLLNECGANCTQEDFLRIDQQVARVERAATLNELAQRKGLTTAQANELAQTLLELAPVYGSGESLIQLVTGRSSLTGDEASRFWAAVGLVPVAGGVLKKVGEPSVEAVSAVLRTEGVNGASKVANGSPPIEGVGNIATTIHTGQQGKHVPGENNFIPGRSTLNASVDPQQLLDGVHSGKYSVVGTGSRGQPIVDFGKPIGVDATTGLSTQYGTIHSGKNGAHIVPTNPTTIK